MTDPTGKRSLFSSPTADEVVDEPAVSGESGKRALYTETSHGRRRVTVECSSCRASVPVDFGHALRKTLTPGAWWLPVKRHSRFVHCPACGVRTWCRVDWLAVLR